MENNVLTEENKNKVLKYTGNSLMKNILIGGATGLVLSGITRRKWPMIFTMSYFIGKSFAESDEFLKKNIKL